MHFINYSLGEACSHMAAILFKVEAFTRLELGKLTCTSLPCLWNQTCTKKVKKMCTTLLVIIIVMPIINRWSLVRL